MVLIRVVISSNNGAHLLNICGQLTFQTTRPGTHAMHVQLHGGILLLKCQKTMNRDKGHTFQYPRGAEEYQRH